MKKDLEKRIEILELENESNQFAITWLFAGFIGLVLSLIIFVTHI